ncbi:hypothetical protein [Campylobacter rectus]|nr:hypothetical protein [Campylobacter rectus]
MRARYDKRIQGINLISLGDRDNARIKLNRAVDRQEGKKKL